MNPPCFTVTPDEALLYLEDGHTVLITSPTQARQLGDLLRQIENALDLQLRDRGSELDRDAAHAMNLANERVHKQYGSTLQTWPPTPTSTELGGAA